MRKAFLAVSLAFLAGMLGTYCGGDGGSSGTPTTSEAAELFANPDGTITEENANEVMESALASADAESLQGLMGAIPGFTKIYLEKAFRKPINIRTQDMSECMTASSDGKTVTIDFGCMAGYISELAECDASGTIEYTMEADTLTAAFTNINVSCGTDEVIIDGTLDILYTAAITEGGLPSIMCFEFDGTENGEPFGFSGCVYVEADSEYQGQVLFTLEDGSHVVLASELHIYDCTHVCAEFTDSTGSVSVDCEVTSPDSCTDATDVDVLGTCTVGTACP